MKRKTNNLLTFEGEWNMDWTGSSIYDVVYDRSLAERAVVENIIKQIKRGY